MIADVRRRAIALYDRFTHEGMNRRAFIRELRLIAGSAAAANALLLAIASNPAAAALTEPDDARLVTRRGRYGLSGNRSMIGYFAAPRGVTGKIPAVMVVHENRGLNRHIEDVTRRVALAGFFAVAPDFLTRAGGTPGNEDIARAEIALLDLGLATTEGVATIDRLRRLSLNNGKVGAIGFCWGGAMVNRVAVAAGDKLDAAVPYYGPAPDPKEASKVKAAMLLHFAGLDERVAKTGEPWVAALKSAGVETTAYTYPGVDHAFNNDTSEERYDAAAAKLAWERTLAFLNAHLKG